jgi:hypothetical protein
MLAHIIVMLKIKTLIILREYRFESLSLNTIASSFILCDSPRSIHKHTYTHTHKHTYIQHYVVKKSREQLGCNGRALNSAAKNLD